MFKRDQPVIGAYARRCPDTMARVLSAVVCSIRIPLHRLGDNLETLMDKDVPESEARAILFGHKMVAFGHIQDNRHELYDSLMEAWSMCAAPGLLLTHLTGIHGLGPAKAGFALQLLFVMVGCLDTHNLRRFSMPEEGFRTRPAMPWVERRKTCERYVQTCERLGGCEKLWDGWCAYVAARRPNVYASADAVSRMHVTSILPREELV